MYELSVSPHFNNYFTSQAEFFFPKTMYTANCDKECMGFKSFVRPGSLVHSMTDDELFWRASMVPKMEQYPFYRLPKVAIMFLACGPLSFLPLWDRFFRGHEGLYSVYLHTVLDYKLNVTEDLAFYWRQIPSEESKILKFLGFMWNPLSWVMEMAAVMAIVLANDDKNPPDWQDFVGIIVLLVINFTISFIEENNAGNAATALMAGLAPKMKVLRDGRWSEQEASILVPGDIVSIKLVDIVSADAHLLKDDPLKIDQSALTGESLSSRTLVMRSSPVPHASRVRLRRSSSPLGGPHLLCWDDHRYHRHVPDLETKLLKRN